MHSAKQQSATQPSAMGTLLQAATYGQTIPTIYGVTQSNVLAIWAANIRQGESNKKLKNFFTELFTKQPPSYYENIDFLIGHNPILGVLQMWNNSSPIPLDFVTQTSGFGTAISISDPDFYAVIGVSIEASYSVTFDDYGGRGPKTFSGTYQIPLWNELTAGPDPTFNSSYRNSPYCYRWQPSYGAEIFIDNDFFVATVTIYYAKLKAATSFLPPIQKEGFAFEPDLGSGPEYANANLSSQQIIYPMFAGMGSSNVDLGIAGVLPSYQAEVQGKFSLYSTGDADFADMIEDVFKSGVAQAAIGASTGTPGYTGIEHGLSSYDFPACVQLKNEASVEAFTIGPISYNLPNTAGNFLVVIATAITYGAFISDTAGNTWIPVLNSGRGSQVWYAQCMTTGPNTVTVNGQSFNWGTILIEIAGVDTLDSVTVGSKGVVSQPTTNVQGFPAYMLAIPLWNVGVGSYNPNPSIPLWEALTPPNTYGGSPAHSLVFERRTKTPGIYTFVEGDPFFTPNDICSLAFKCVNAPSYPAPLGDFMDFGSLDLVRLQCRANGLWGSLTMNSQQKASDWLNTLYGAADAAPVFCGFKLFSMPYSEVSAVGNGVVYTAPTAGGPVYNLSANNGDFVGSEVPITVKTAARVDQPNVLQMQCINRTSNYNPSVVEQPDAASISLFGVRKADPIVNNAVQDVSIARQLLGIVVRKLQYGGDVYTFTLPAKWCLLAPMGAGGGGNNDAVITVSDPLADINSIPVRITSMTEQPDQSLECEAEPFVYGMYAPTPFNADAPQPFSPDPTVSAGDINAPVIFEPVPRLYANASQAQLWMVVSSSNADYGGCQVYISTDGGSSYVPLGTIMGNGVTGHSTGDWPAHADPDTTNNLPLDLTESNGTLLSYSTADENNFVYPCYIAGGGAFSIPYELMTYAIATLTGTNLYTLMATGGGHELRRGVFGAPSPGVGVDHPTTSRFAFLNPSGQGILKVNMDPTWIGVTLYFKFPSFNTFGGGLQSLSDATAYSYTPTGVPGLIGPAGGWLVNGS